MNSTAIFRSLLSTPVVFLFYITSNAGIPENHRDPLLRLHIEDVSEIGISNIMYRCSDAPGGSVAFFAHASLNWVHASHSLLHILSCVTLVFGKLKIYYIYLRNKTGIYVTKTYKWTSMNNFSSIYKTMKDLNDISFLNKWKNMDLFLEKIK